MPSTLRDIQRVSQSNTATRHRLARGVPRSAPIVHVVWTLLCISITTLAQSCSSPSVFVVTAFQPASTFHRFALSRAKLSTGKNDLDLVPPAPTSKTDSFIDSGAADRIVPDTEPSSGFGRSVRYVPLSQRTQQSPTTAKESFSINNACDELQIRKRNRRRNIAVAIASFAFSVIHYAWQFTHPVSAVELLATMQSQSAPLTSIGNNGKPTVIDFWAPWCENCKVAAPTLKAVEEEYGDRVNFIMVNGDDGRNWPLIELFGVDAIPHLALLSNRGDVETALIGPMSRNVLRADIDALLTIREGCREDAPVPEQAAETILCHEELPYKMYDAFGNRPESRRIKFVEQ